MIITGVLCLIIGLLVGFWIGFWHGRSYELFLFARKAGHVREGELFTDWLRRVRKEIHEDQ